MNDARLWHPWLRINRVLRVMLHTRFGAEAWAGSSFRQAPTVRVRFGTTKWNSAAATYSASQSVFSGSSVAPAPFLRCNS